MACCAIDAQPYVLPVEKVPEMTYEKDTWLRVKGKLTRKTIQGNNHLVIVPESIVRLDNPENPYEYINTTTAPLISSSLRSK